MDKNPSSASDDVTVFLDTSLDTHLAITVSGNDTVSDLKRKLENEHPLSFEEIKIRALKVDRRGTLYHLSDSMRVKCAVSGVDRECFLFADASIIEKRGEIQHGSHNFGSGICDNPLVSGADRPFNVLSKRLFSVDDSVPLLLEGKKNNIVDQNGSVDSGRETLKDLEMGIKHSDYDHCKTSFDETINGLEPKTQADRSLCSEGFRVPTAQEHREDTSKKEISEAKSSASLGKASPSSKNRQQNAKQKSEETAHLKENDTPVYGFNEEQSRIDIVPPEDSLGNEGGDVPCDTVVVNRTTTEEPRRASASNMDNRSDSGLHRNNDTYKETEVSGKHTDIRLDAFMHCNTAVEDASQSQTVSKKKRKFENITDLEDSLKENNVLICDSTKEASQQDASQSWTASKKRRKFEKVTDLEDLIKENNVLICDSNKEASQPEITSELSAGKTASTTFDGSLAETTDLLTNSSRGKKNKKKKKALNPLHQIVGAAPSGNGDMEERSMVDSAGINNKNSSGEDVAPISSLGPNCASIRELQENCKAPSSLDFNKATEEKPEGHPPLVVKAPSENGTSSAERVQEKREPSQTNDSEALLSESQNKTDGNNAKLIVTSELLDSNEPVTPSKKKRKKRKTKDSIGVEHIVDSQCDISLAEPHEAVHGQQDSDKAKNEESNFSQKNGKDVSEKDTESCHLVMEPVTPSKKKKKKRKTKDSTGAEHIVDSQCDISLAEPHEAVHGEQDSDKAKNEESNFSQKNGKDISEKDTKSCHLVMEADKCDGNEVETLQQVGKTPANAESTKKKSKRKHDAMTKDLQKLEAEEKSASHQDPALTTDNRTEAVASKRKKSKLAKTTLIDQSNAKCLESGSEHGVQIGSLHACSNFMSESTKLPSHAQEHIAGMSLKPNLSGNHEEVSCEGEEINFHKYMVPSQSKNEVVASGEVHAEEVTKSKKADNKQKPKKNRKAVDSSGCSWDPQSSLKSHDNQGIGEKSEASKSSSVQPQGSISNVDGVVPQPEEIVPKKVSKTGTKAQSSDASGKINSIPKVAGKRSLANGSGVNSITEKKNEVVAISSSKTEKSNNKDQKKPVKKHQSGVSQNVVASGKASGNDDGEVLNSSKGKKSSATPLAPEYRNKSSEGKDGFVDSGASTTSSDYSLSSESDYSDGESNAGSCASSGKKNTGRSGYSSIKGKPARRLKNDEIFLNSSVYKKAKLAASQSQLEEDSQAPEFVPDSQPAF